MFVRPKRVRENSLKADTRVAHAARPTSASNMQGNIGGENEVAILTSEATRDLRKKVWWALAHDVLQALYNVAPSSVGHVRNRTEATMERWYRSFHERGCLPFV